MMLTGVESRLRAVSAADRLHFIACAGDGMPLEVIHALAWVRWAGAWVNRDLGMIDPDKAQAIVVAAERVADGSFDSLLAASEWQTESGNLGCIRLGEVLAELASRPAYGALGRPRPVDARADVDLGLPPLVALGLAVTLAVALKAKARLLPALVELRRALGDGCPPSWSAHAGDLETCEAGIRQALSSLHELGITGTLGVQSPFGVALVDRLSQRLDLPLVAVPARPGNPAGQPAMLTLHASLKTLALVLHRAGAEAWAAACPGGASLEPRREDPLAAQVEVLAQVCARVVGHDAAIGFAASQPQTLATAYKPLIGAQLLGSLLLLSDAMQGFGQIGLNRVR